MAFLAENVSSHKHEDALWPPFFGHDEVIPAQFINHREYPEDDKFARVHFYLERGKDRRKDGIFLRCAICGQTGHTETNLKSVLFPESVSNRGSRMMQQTSHIKVLALQRRGISPLAIIREYPLVTI